MEKRSTLVALLFCLGMLPYGASAQDGSPALQKAPTSGQQELGINLFSWINVNIEDIHGLTPPGGDVRYVNGLLYKWHCQRNVLRAGVDVFRDRYTIGTRLGDGANYPSGHGYRKGHSTDTRFRIGYERRLGDGRLQPFIGVDVGLHYFQDHYEFEGNGDFVYNPTYGTGSVTTQQLFIAPFVGLDYRFADHWSVAMEVAVTYCSGRATYQSKGLSRLSPDGWRSSWDQRERGSALDPLRSFSVVYHF